MKSYPTILKPDEIFNKAFGRASKITVNDRNSLRRNREMAIRKAISVSDIITSTLSLYSEMLADIEKKSEFYREMIDNIMGINRLVRARHSITWASKRCMELRMEKIRQYRKATDVPAVLELQKAFYGRISSIVNSIAGDLKTAAELRAWFRKFPDIIDEFTVVVAGYPNVGKSSLINDLSSGKPEINTYPFTTKDIKVGHMETAKYRRIQIIDTPGILDRPIENRNSIEKQALTAIKYLAHHILFLIDMSETCGFDIPSQEALLNEIKGFMNVPLTIITSKYDLSEKDYPNSEFVYSSVTGGDRDKIIDHLKRLEKEWFREYGSKITYW